MGSVANDDSVVVAFIGTIGIPRPVCLRLNTAVLLVGNKTAGDVTLAEVPDGVAEVTQFTYHRNLQFDKSHHHANDQDGANEYNFRRQNDAVFIVPEVLHISRLFT
jgi:hypothetical protein